MKLQSVILAGGSGNRLWPLSNRIKPKQFIKYLDSLSSFQNTVIRNKHLGIPTVVTDISYEKIIKTQLKEINIQANLIFEPERKNTAACAVAASYHAKKRGFDGIILLPADHHIANQENYVDTLAQAIKTAERYQFITIGIKPKGFNPNFGYIRKNFKIDNNLYSVSKFIEKPTEKFNDTYSYFWNSGIYIYEIDYFLSLAKKFIPLTVENLSRIPYDNEGINNEFRLEPDLYKNLPSVSFDDAVSVNSEKTVTVESKFTWDDLGNWEAMCKLGNQDDNHNNILGKVITYNVKNSYINSDAKQTIVIDLKNIIVVFKKGRLFISHKNGAGRIKDILVQLGN